MPRRRVEPTVDLEAEDEVWAALYRTTKEVLLTYAPIVTYYVKATHPHEWKEMIGEATLGETPLGVLKDIAKHKDCLNTAGGTRVLYQKAKELQHYFEIEEPNLMVDRMRFRKIAIELIEALPYSDAFPYNPQENPTDRSTEMRRLCGIFYSLHYKMDMPTRWFKLYANAYPDAVEKSRQEQRSVHRIIRDTIGSSKDSGESDSDEDELHQRHVLFGEPLGRVLESIRLRRKRKQMERAQTATSSDRESTSARTSHINPLFEEIDSEYDTDASDQRKTRRRLGSEM